MAVTTLKHWFDRFTEATGQEVTHILGIQGHKVFRCG
jgi:hypothetical protein